MLRAAKLGFKHCAHDELGSGRGLPLREARAVAVPRRASTAASRASGSSSTRSASSRACRPTSGRPRLDVEPRLSYVIGRLDRVLRRRLSAAVEPTGLTLPAYTALSVLRAQDGLSNARLARRSLVTPQSMSEVLALLVEQGYVRRSAEPGHGRVIRMRADGGGQPGARAVRPRRRRRRAGDARRPRRGRGGEPPRRPDPLRADARRYILRPKRLRRKYAKEFEAQTLLEATIGVAAHLESELEEALAEHRLTRASYPGAGRARARHPATRSTSASWWQASGAPRGR